MYLGLMGAVQFGSVVSTAAEFEGTWTGEIIGPDKRAFIGLAFTRAENETLVSISFPEMFLYGANFGPAEIQDGKFRLDALNLTLTREGDSLSGTFATGRLPVRLHRGGTFPQPPARIAAPVAPAPAWTRSLGASAWASPTARDGIVYIGTIDGAFHAIRADHGETSWTWKGSHPIYGEALVTEDSVLFVDEAMELVSLLRTTGIEQWRLPLHDAALCGYPVPKNETFNHRAVSPVSDGKGVIYVGSTDGGVYAVRAKTGRKLWRHDAKTKVYGAVTLHDQEVIVGGFDGSVFSFNRRTHVETARVKLGGAIVSAPVWTGDRLIVGCRDYFLYGLNATTRATAWKDTYWFSWVESTPRVVDGVAYIGGSDFRRVSALDPASGKLFWSTDVQGLAWGSPVVTRDVVYIGTAGQTIEGTVIQHRGGVTALDRKTGAMKWRYSAPVIAGADFVGIAGSLTLADRKVIGVQVDGTLIAFAVDTQ
jgi:outer membrane protein assembly factor BamB